jgi:ribosomal protein S19
MGFFDTYGKPANVKKVDKKLSAEEMLKKGIEQQEKLLNGEQVLNAKGKTIRSWFRDGRFIPSVGVFGLFDGKAYSFKKGDEKEMLSGFKISFEAGEFAGYIKVLDKRREENTAKLIYAKKANKELKLTK